MQRAEESESRAGGLTPINAFLVGLGLLVAIAAVVLLSRPDEAPVPSPDPNPEPAFELTDAEAIERFELLGDLRTRSLRERDVSLLRQVFTPGSPAAERIAESIRKLIRGSAYYRTRHVVESIKVLSNSEEAIVISERVVIHPKFLNESGQDVTVDPIVERQTTEWTLKLVSGDWLIHDGVIVSAEPVKK